MSWLRLVLHLACGLVCVSASAEAVKLTPVTVCVPRFRSDFMSMLTLEALDEGFFKLHGLDVRLHWADKVGPGNPGWKARKGPLKNPSRLDRGIADFVTEAKPKCDFGSSNIDRFLADPAATKKVVPLITSMYGENYDTHLVVARDSPIKDVKELKGKRLQVGQIPSVVAVEGVLKSAGLTLDDVQLESDVEGMDKIQGLQKGELAALTAWFPFMSYMLASDNVRILSANIVQSHLVKRLPHSTMIVGRAFMDRNPNLVAKFMWALKDAYTHLQRNPADILYRLARHSGSIGDHRFYVSNLLAEKAGTFLGPVIMTDLTTSGGSADQIVVACAVKEYHRKLRAHGYFDHEVDLSPWLSGEKRDCL